MEPAPRFAARQIINSRPVLSLSLQVKLSTWKFMEILQLLRWLQHAYWWLLTAAFNIIVLLRHLSLERHPAAVMVQKAEERSASTGVGESQLEQRRSHSSSSESAEMVENQQELRHWSVSPSSMSSEVAEMHLGQCQCSSSSSGVNHNNLENLGVSPSPSKLSEVAKNHLRCCCHRSSNPSSVSSEMIEKHLDQCQCCSSSSSDTTHSNSEHHCHSESPVMFETQRNQQPFSDSASSGVIRINFEHFVCHSSRFRSSSESKNNSENHHSHSSPSSETPVTESRRKHRRSFSFSESHNSVNDHRDQSHLSPKARKGSDSINSVASATVCLTGNHSEYDFSSKLLSITFRSPCDEDSDDMANGDCSSSDEESLDEDTGFVVIMQSNESCFENQPPSYFMDDDDDDDSSMFGGDDDADNESVCFCYDIDVDSDLMSESDDPTRCSESNQSKRVHFDDSIRVEFADDYDRMNVELLNMLNFRHAIEQFGNQTESSIFSEDFRQKIYQERFNSAHSCASE